MPNISEKALFDRAGYFITRDAANKHYQRRFVMLSDEGVWEVLDPNNPSAARTPAPLDVDIKGYDNPKVHGANRHD